MDGPSRGFSVDEYRSRTVAAQALMADAELDALLVCTEPEVRYFSGRSCDPWTLRVFGHDC